jgi:hypothetical protein
MKAERSIVWVLLVICLYGAAARQALGLERSLEWKEFEGKRYVSSASLKEAGIEVKRLPGERKLAVCTSNKCFVISDFVPDERSAWLGSVALEAAGVKIIEANGTWNIIIEADATKETGTRVGSFTPNLQFALLDGRTMRLSDFVGKRVLINNWASW